VDHSENPKPDIYAEVTARIVSELEQGRFPWVQPWGKAGHSAAGLPHNAGTGARYSGINILILWGAGISASYPTLGWLTFRQALNLGGCVRKGECGTTVVYADKFTPKSELERAAREGAEAAAVPFLKRFTVFNVAQCDGLEGVFTAPEPLPERELNACAEALITATGADFRMGGDRAFYVPAADYIQVPPQPAFHDQINYYRTCFHELTHWTGHPTRLNREQSGGHGSALYAREELVAEMGSAFVCATLGVPPTVRHADYLASWLSVLREDNRAIFRAASQASKAADLLLGFRPASEPQASAAAGEIEGDAA
jgi:antirestriction protein ArdC